MKVLALTALAALSACARGSGNVIGTDAGQSVDLGAPDDTPMGDVGEPDAADVAPSPDDAATPSDAAPDTAPSGCQRDEQCASDPAGAVCDTATGRCVGCVAARPTCRSGTYCEAATNTCQAGCNADSDCGAGGVTRCELSSHRCVGCNADGDCALGTVCQSGACVAGCNERQGCGVGAICCNSQCVNPSSSATHCGGCGQACATGSSCCGGVCIDTQGEVANCGRCGNQCVVPGATATCSQGRCAVGACAAGFGDCDANAANGCETPTAADPANCGACGMACATGPNATARCAAGRCSTECATGYGDCDNTPGNGCEARLPEDPRNCGACGQVCPTGPNAVARCNGGVCASTCASGFGDCDSDPSNGCEAALGTSTSHCGACGVVCVTPNATPSCNAGACVVGACRAGFADCDGDPRNGCETATAADNSNCGACNRRCGAGTACSNGACSSVCAGGTTFCTDRCVDLRSDVASCGSCDRQCPAVANGSAACDQGACGLRCNPGFADCSGGGVDGCETNLRASDQHCGACGAVCQRSNAQARCSDAVCRITLCSPGFDNCNGNDGDGCETSLVSDTRNCGGCGRLCVRNNAVPSCVAGACAIAACTGGFGNCNSLDADGCETSLVSDNLNCGACGRACGPGTACSNGTCASVCTGGTTFCAGACVSLQTDLRNCGACGNVCAAGRSCVAGSCVTVGPANDRCNAAQELNLGQRQSTLSVNLTGANHDVDALCTSLSGADVYYRFTLTSRELVYADTFGTSFDTVLFFASGCTTPMPSGTTAGDQTCNDDSVCGSLQSQVVALLNPGTYYLVVAGYSSNVGTVNIRFQHLPAGNGAVSLLSAGATNPSGTTSGTGSTSECAGSGPENTYWWRTCPADGGGTLSAQTCNRASWDTVLYLRNGDGSVVGSGATCNDDGCGTQSTISAGVSAGAGLHTLTVDGYFSTSSGSYTVAVTRP
ncbi:MAG: hypothetical protein JNK72_01145 [Myxococcales bacterium]|nr:hypothetical protein [Myxococcales bacterium]